MTTAHNADDIERATQAVSDQLWQEFMRCSEGNECYWECSTMTRESSDAAAKHVTPALLDAVSDRIAARALTDATERIEKARAAYIAEHPGTQKPQHWDTQYRDYESGVVDGFTLAARAADLGESEKWHVFSDEDRLSVDGRRKRHAADLGEPTDDGPRCATPCDEDCAKGCHHLARAADLGEPSTFPCPDCRSQGPTHSGACIYAVAADLGETPCEHDWLGPTDDAAPICRKCEAVMPVPSPGASE